MLKNTLSDNGGVTRGICKMDDQNNLTEVVETKNIVKTADGAEADGNHWANSIFLVKPRKILSSIMPTIIALIIRRTQNEST